MRQVLGGKQGTLELWTFCNSDLAEFSSDKDIFGALMGRQSTFIAHMDSFNRLHDPQAVS